MTVLFRQHQEFLAFCRVNLEGLLPSNSNLHPQRCGPVFCLDQLIVLAGSQSTWSPFV